MKKHISNYLKHYKIGEQDTWLCGNCGRFFRINNGLEIHHIIFKSLGGSDDIENCICLCRNCHIRAHSGELTVEYLQGIHKPKFQS